ncbi:MAG: N-acetylmuramoyl-L-alanine amidase [Gemmatimonadota bacterium]|nr:N-acetylmuramoyl-L-alanine amidase [Candidatus Palauibacterales bacterium]
MRSRNGSVVVVALLAFGLAAAPAPADRALDLVIVRAGTTRSVRVVDERGYPAASAAKLAETLGYSWSQGALLLDNATVRFHDGSPFFAFGDAIHQLPNPAYRIGPELMVPVTWALEWLPMAQPRRWRNIDGRLVERPADVERRDRREPWLVVIDAGHGGRDPGAVGVNGTAEKNVTLAIAKRLEKRLEREPDVVVVMTRGRDTLVALADRPRIPQIRGYTRAPDLFISIHGNSMPKKPNSTRGFETYFLAVAKTEEARQVALRENASLRFEGDDAEAAGLDPLQFMLSDLQSTANLRESSLFASSINRSMGVTLPTPDLGVRQAGFWVLIGASMPAALVEVGYLSNPSEEKQLRSGSYQAKIADALADGIVNYLAGYGQRVWSTPRAGA